MNLKSSISKVLLGTFALASFSSSALAVTPVTAHFDDVPEGHANAEAILYLRDKDVVNGYDGNVFRPDNQINRAEFLRIVMDAADIELGGSNCYSDVKDEWFAPYICKATELGYVSGDAGKKTFRPADPVNFVEASKILSNVLLEKTQASEDPWYKAYVQKLEKFAVIPSSIVSFDQKLTRGEMAEMVWRIDSENTEEISNTYENISKGRRAYDPKIAANGEGFQTFASCDDFSSYISYIKPRGDYGYEEYAEDEDVGESVTSNADNKGGANPVDYSQTNVQVAGVDEADIVKTDGEYIYALDEESVHIVRAYTPDKLQEVATIDLVGEKLDIFYAREMYVDGDKLVLIGYGSRNTPYYSDEKKIAAGDEVYWGSDLSEVRIYDISDKSKPTLDRKVAFEGNYVSSRKVDDTVYLVASKYIYNYFPEEIIPLKLDSAQGNEYKEAVNCSSIYYDPQARNRSFTVLAAIPVDDASKEVTQEVIMGSSDDIYASEENIYTTDNTYNWGSEYSSLEETKIHKFSLDGNKIEHVADGVVPGSLLNQFSMDENDGEFRVATTEGNTWDSSASNNVYVLDENLKQIGDLEEIAPGESIYSARFMGDRLYLVTFKKVDPFFVIDLSDGKNPKVLGALKIPGYSNYLHPLDENHIIGFGKDTVDPTDEESNNFWGVVDFAWYQGLKMAIFDVSDVSNPVELHKEIIGDRGTDSELLSNHKALMYDAKKGILALPVMLAELPESVAKDPDIPQSAYGQYTYQGAYVYDVSVEDGFNLRGKITHYKDSELGAAFGYYAWGDKNIERILYIGDYLYTVSKAKIQANKSSDLKLVNSVELK